jgi:hypothetical protein
MLAPANLPRLYRRLNERHGAPFGRALPRKRLWTYLQRGKREEQLRKPFCMQPNYTNTGIQWPFEFARLGLNMRVADFFLIRAAAMSSILILEWRPMVYAGPVQCLVLKKIIG